jgi:plastocyanin
VGAGLLLVQVVAAPLVLAGDPCYHGFEVPAATVESSTGVKLLPCAFEPTVAVVPAGATVTFGSAPGGQVHLITGANQAWGERDTEVAPGARVTYTFEEPGVYPYACALHRGMTGAIVVGDGGPALAAAMAAAGTGGAPPAVGEPAATTGEPAGSTTSGVPAIAAVGLGALVALGAVALLAASRRSRRPESVTPEALPH